MSAPFSYLLVGDPPVTPTTDGSAAARPYASRTERAYLGFGLLAPFVRDQKGDFANGGGEALVRSCVAQVLGTECTSEDGSVQGELPWDPEFGSLLRLLRHRQMDEVLQQVAQVYVADALRRWEPRVRLTSTRFEKVKSSGAVRVEDAFVVHLTYDFVSENSDANQVVLTDINQTVRVG